MSLFHRFYIYRKLNNGRYRRVGQVELNYNQLPFKQKYYAMIGITSNDCGLEREQHLKPDKWSK